MTEQPGTCPFEVERAVMTQRWLRLAFLHWSFEPDEVQRLLPSGLTVETFDERAWVGLVPFFMQVGTPGGHHVPWASNFCETNVRTYVRDAAGRSGIWFFSLEAARLGAVLVARTTYRLPYFWADMSVSGAGDRLEYRSSRRWPGPAGTSSRVDLALGRPYEQDELTARDHWLTARWMLFSVAGRSGTRQRHARAAHQPWPLHRATVTDLDDELVAAAGLRRPTTDPLVHYSPGVQVRIGAPERSG
jgi:uncharacterized protein YqjF (DUF2071 family)